MTTQLLVSLGLFLSAGLFATDEIQIGFTVSAPWEIVAGGHTGTYRVAEALGPQSPKKTATWRVTLPVADRDYRVQVTWTPDPRNARHAGFSIYDGKTALKQVQINQQLPPRGEKVGDFVFQDLGRFRVSGKTLQVDLTNDADGRVVADTVRVQ